jgi:predicted ATPase/DNA-binding CsgD family transcriptional regulator
VTALDSDSIESRLPADLTSFVGREREAAEVVRLLGGTRLLTLTGPGGVGKTRLAIHVARTASGSFADGIALAELASLTDGALVGPAVAAAVGVPDQASGGEPVVRSLAAFLRPRVMLLVVDNCEHLVGACAELAETLLRGCPNLRVLATSRQPLGVAGEVAWPVPSLGLPPTGAHDPAAHEAVRLFVERARAARPDFVLAADTGPAVVETVRRLDGVPLAIELAAARVAAMSPAEIASRLADRFALLTTGDRTAPARHRTLRATMDWSFDLLDAAEQRLFRRLGVFAGGFLLEAAEEVCSGDGIDPGAVLDLLAGLVSRSLVAARPEGRRTRYVLLETVRAYALERLAAAGESESVRGRHAAHYRDFVECAELRVRGPDQVAWLDRLDAEHDNIRAALAYGADRPAELETALRIVGALWRFWGLRGYATEGRRWCARVLGVDEPGTAGSLPPTSAAARALCTAAVLPFLQGDHRAALPFAEEAVRIGRQVGDPATLGPALIAFGAVLFNHGEHARAKQLIDEQLSLRWSHDPREETARGLHWRATLARAAGQLDAARHDHEQALALARELGDLWYETQILSGLGLTAARAGDFAAARRAFAACLAVRERLRDGPGVAWSRINLGDAARAEGDLAAAGEHYRAALNVLQRVGDRAGTADARAALGWVALERNDLPAARGHAIASLALRHELHHWAAVPGALEQVAAVAAAGREPATALRLAAAADALRVTFGVPASPEERRTRERWCGAPRTPADREAWEAGRALTPEQAVAEALALEVVEDQVGALPVRVSGVAGPLSPREREVADLIAAGLSNQEIAERLVISERTAERHAENIRTKLGVRSRAQVAAWVERERLAGRLGTAVGTAPDALRGSRR